MKELLFAFFPSGRRDLTVHSFLHVEDFIGDAVFHVAHYLLHFGTVLPANFDLFFFSVICKGNISPFRSSFYVKVFHLIFIFLVKALF